MHRYLLVLEEDLLTVDEELGMEPISYLVERQEQEPCEVVVLSLSVVRIWCGRCAPRPVVAITIR